jgi:hypothetical protein
MWFGLADEKKFWLHYNKDDAWFLKKGTIKSRWSTAKTSFVSW